MTIKITRDVNLDEKSIHIEDDKLTVNVSTNPDNKLKKTENGLEVLVSGSGLELGTKTKTFKAQIEHETCTLVFTELLNHNKNGKRMFVCTDVIQDSNSLIEETTEASGSNSNMGGTPPVPPPPPAPSLGEEDVLNL